jgi:hypothetical protein
MIASAALALAACGSNGTDGNVAADTAMTAEAITANDVTAIDAVTGHAANMAADVDYSNVSVDNVSDKPSAKSGTAKRPQAKPEADGLTDPIHDAGDEAPAPANAQ